MIRIFKVTVFFITYLFFATIVLAQPAKYNAFRVRVTGKGQPVILIPGATCSSDEWNETISHMGSGYQYHALTLAGYAGTPALPGGPYLETIKNQIEQYITDNKLNKVVLVGHSIGGVLSLWIASELKQRLQKVIVVDAMPFLAGAQNPGASATYSEEKARAAYERYRSMDDNQMKTNQLAMTKFMCADSTRWEQIVTWGALSDRKTLAYTMTEMMSKDLRADIARIDVPVLVLAAYKTQPAYPQFTRQGVTEVFTAQYKACGKCSVHVAEDGAKHFIMYDNPKWYYAEIDSFLKS